MQQISVIASSKDYAGVNIRNSLIRLFDFKNIGEKFDNNGIFQYNKIPNKVIKLYLVNDDLIFLDGIDEKIGADILIFASKHRSKENTPSLAVHPIGNWSKADFGGKEKTLCPSSAFLLKTLFIKLNENFSYFSEGKNFHSNFQITMEATHHGPYVAKPAVFAEIGSTDKEWNDTLNGEIIAKTIINAVEMLSIYEHKTDWIPSFLLGGGHYAQSGSKTMLNTDYAIGHICPKYMLEHLTEEILLQAVDMTIPKPKIALLDWKGLGKYKQKTVALLENSKIECKRIQNI